MLTNFTESNFVHLKFGFPMIFLNLYITYFQTDMIIFDQFKVPTIKVGKGMIVHV